MSQAQRPARRGPVRALMDACRGPYALPAFGGISVLESSFVPVPIDLAMVPICAAQRNRIPLIVLVGGIGSTIGAVIGYLIGALLMQTVGMWILDLYGFRDEFAAFQDLYEMHGWMAVVVAGITPLPFQVATLVSGAAGMSFGLFFVAAFGIRLVRFALMGAIIAAFGAALARLMERRAGTVAIVMTVLTILGFLALPAVVDMQAPPFVDPMMTPLP